MNNLSSKNRKLVYLLLILVLLVPIIMLGSPADRDSSGGILAQQRQKENLTQTSLGEVDPSSAIMKVVLLGFRGVAADLLWMQAKEQQKKKEWGKYRATAHSILLLQPNFEEVWRYAGWNMSYNISSEWDAVDDRYYWVKEGGKFLRNGVKQNQYSAALQWEVGRVMGQKIGRADERSHYRAFFKADPDPQFEGKTDPAFNVNEIDDHYLAAREEYLYANKIDTEHGQMIMIPPIFRQYPTRSWMDAAAGMHRDGIFNDVTRDLWSKAYEEWVGEAYGKYPFFSQGGKYYLEATEEDLQELAEFNAELTGGEYPVSSVKKMIQYFQSQTQYEYWRTRCLAEGEELTLQAHKHIYEGKKAFQEADMEGAMKTISKGMELFEQVLRKYPIFAQGDPVMVDEALEAVLYWNYIWDTHSQATNKPTEYPLKWLWEQNRDKIPELNRLFKIDNEL